MSGATLRRVLTFAAIGVINTGIYAAIAYGGVRFAGLAAGVSAAVGYLCGALFSYFCNRLFTFRGTTAHGSAAPRFILANAVTFAIGVLVPTVLVDVSGVALGLSVIIASFIVPPCNYILMNRFVFAGAGTAQDSELALRSR